MSNQPCLAQLIASGARSSPLICHRCHYLPALCPLQPRICGQGGETIRPGTQDSQTKSARPESNLRAAA